MEFNFSPIRRTTIDRIGNYQILKTIGKGQFGKVKLAQHLITEEKVAIKIIHKAKMDANSLAKVTREVEIMKMFAHPHVVRLYEVMENDEFLVLVMEHASGEVIDLLIAHGRLRENVARQFFRQIVQAIDYCHQLHVVHRDIKLENLLLDQNFRIKIIDFGLSNAYTPGGLLKTFCGSPTYSAPELIQQRKYEGPEIDIWSMGVVLFVLLCGFLPFDGKNFSELFSKIVHGEFLIPHFVSEGCRDLISRMLVVNPKERATMEEIIGHAWMNDPHPFVRTIPQPKDKQVPIESAVLDQLCKHSEYKRESVINSVTNSLYNDEYATYSLMYYRYLEQQQIQAQKAQATPKEKASKHRRARTVDTGSQKATMKGRMPESSRDEKERASQSRDTEKSEQSHLEEAELPCKEPTPCPSPTSPLTNTNAANTAPIAISPQSSPALSHATPNSAVPPTNSSGNASPVLEKKDSTVTSAITIPKEIPANNEVIALRRKSSASPETTKRKTSSSLRNASDKNQHIHYHNATAGGEKEPTSTTTTTKVTPPILRRSQSESTSSFSVISKPKEIKCVRRDGSILSGVANPPTTSQQQPANTTPSASPSSPTKIKQASWSLREQSPGRQLVKQFFSSPSQPSPERQVSPNAIPVTTPTPTLNSLHSSGGMPTQVSPTSAVNFSPPNSSNPSPTSSTSKRSLLVSSGPTNPKLQAQHQLHIQQQLQSQLMLQEHHQQQQQMLQQMQQNSSNTSNSNPNLFQKGVTMQRLDLNVPRGPHSPQAVPSHDEEEIIIPLNDSPKSNKLSDLLHIFQETFHSSQPNGLSQKDSVMTRKQNWESQKHPRLVKRLPVDVETITQQSPEIILNIILNLLGEFNISHVFVSPFCLFCTSPGQDLDFELEICSIPNLDVNCFRFSRIAGDVWKYQKMCQTILNLLKAKREKAENGSANTSSTSLPSATASYKSSEKSKSNKMNSNY